MPMQALNQYPPINIIVNALFNHPDINSIISEFCSVVMHNGKFKETDIQSFKSSIPPLYILTTILTDVVEMASDDYAEFVTRVHSGDTMAIMESFVFQSVIVTVCQCIDTPITPVLNIEFEDIDGIIKVFNPDVPFEFDHPFIQWIHNTGIVIQSLKPSFNLKDAHQYKTSLLTEEDETFLVSLPL